MSTPGFSHKIKKSPLNLFWAGSLALTTLASCKDKPASPPELVSLIPTDTTAYTNGTGWRAGLREQGNVPAIAYRIARDGKITDEELLAFGVATGWIKLVGDREFDQLAEDYNVSSYDYKFLPKEAVEDQDSAITDEMLNNGLMLELNKEHKVLLTDVIDEATKMGKTYVFFQTAGIKELDPPVSVKNLKKLQDFSQRIQAVMGLQNIPLSISNMPDGQDSRTFTHDTYRGVTLDMSELRQPLARQYFSVGHDLAHNMQFEGLVQATERQMERQADSLIAVSYHRTAEAAFVANISSMETAYDSETVPLVSGGAAICTKRGFQEHLETLRLQTKDKTHDDAVTRTKTVILTAAKNYRQP